MQYDDKNEHEDRPRRVASVMRRHMWLTLLLNVITVTIVLLFGSMRVVPEIRRHLASLVTADPTVSSIEQRIAEGDDRYARRDYDGALQSYGRAEQYIVELLKHDNRADVAERRRLLYLQSSVDVRLTLADIGQRIAATKPPMRPAG